MDSRIEEARDRYSKGWRWLFIVAPVGVVVAIILNWTDCREFAKDAQVWISEHSTHPSQGSKSVSLMTANISWFLLRTALSIALVVFLCWWQRRRFLGILNGYEDQLLALKTQAEATHATHAIQVTDFKAKMRASDQMVAHLDLQRTDLWAVLGVHHVGQESDKDATASIALDRATSLVKYALDLEKQRDHQRRMIEELVSKANDSVISEQTASAELATIRGDPMRRLAAARKKLDELIVPARTIVARVREVMNDRTNAKTPEQWQSVGLASKNLADTHEKFWFDAHETIVGLVSSSILVPLEATRPGSWSGASNEFDLRLAAAEGLLAWIEKYAREDGALQVIDLRGTSN